MIWLLIVIVIAALPVWMFFAPVEASLDTRVPVVVLRWRLFGRASFFFEEEEFWLRINLVFWQWQWRLADLTNRTKKAKAKTKNVQVKKGKSRFSFRKVIRIMKCLQIKQCDLALRPDNYVVTAQLYPLNFIKLPYPYKFSIDFTGDSYLLMKITTAPWRVVYAWLRN
ncbi:MAG: hypothetical protein ACJ75B_21255 [Flavisolibacter sp.]